MSAVYVHLLINHFPPILGITATVVMIIAMPLRNETIFRTGAWILVAAALFGVPTFLTGDGAADTAKTLPGVVRNAIDPHEEAADVTLGLMIAAAVAALAMLLFFRKGRAIPGWAAAIVLVIGIAATGSAVWTAHLGGLIRHPEATPSGRPATPQPAGAARGDSD